MNIVITRLLYLSQSTQATPSTTILISMKIYQRTARKVSIKNTTVPRRMIFILQTILTQKIRIVRILAQTMPPLEMVSVLLRGRLLSISSLTGTNCPRKFTDTPSTEFPDTTTTNSITSVQGVFKNAMTNRSGHIVSANSRARSQM